MPLKHREAQLTSDSAIYHVLEAKSVSSLI